MIDPNSTDLTDEQKREFSELMRQDLLERFAKLTPEIDEHECIILQPELHDFIVAHIRKLEHAVEELRDILDAMHRD